MTEDEFIDEALDLTRPLREMTEDERLDQLKRLIRKHPDLATSILLEHREETLKEFGNRDDR